MEETRSPPPMSFSSLPYDITLNILARITRMHHPTLSLDSKSFRSILSSRELQATRTLIGKTENYIYFCLKLDRHSKPRWFILPPTPTQRKLIPIPSFPWKHPESPTVVSIGSEIYLIGGLVNEERSRRVFLLDCLSHKWHTLPDLRIPRGKSAAGLIDGKIYVFGGCGVGENWGEIYDPKTQTWELLSPTTLTPHILIQKRIQEMMYWMPNFCFVVEEKILCTIGSVLTWCDADEKNTICREVKGLDKKLNFNFIANTSGGRRLTVWWRTKKREEEEEVVKAEIWCAEISFERPSKEELYGIMEGSKMICTLDFVG